MPSDYEEARTIAGLLRTQEQSYQEMSVRPDALRPSFRIVLDQWLLKANSLLGDENLVIAIIEELHETIRNRRITNGLVWEDAAYIACALENRFRISEGDYDGDQARTPRQAAREVASLLRTTSNKYNDSALRCEPLREAVCHMLEYCVHSAETLIGEDPNITPVINDYLPVLMARSEGFPESDIQIIQIGSPAIAFYLEDKFELARGGGNGGFEFSLDTLPSLDPGQYFRFDWNETS
jgi:hypothetical protein